MRTDKLLMMVNYQLSRQCGIIYGLVFGVQFLRLGKEGYTKIMLITEHAA